MNVLFIFVVLQVSNIVILKVTFSESLTYIALKINKTKDFLEF